jgi:predicted N-acetyltransferase YhbS
VGSVELVDMPQFGADDYAAIVDGEPDPYGTEELGIVWRTKTSHIGAREEGRLIGHAGWVPAEVEPTSGATVKILGLGSVMMHRHHRGNGVGGRLVLGAMQRMGEVGDPVAMLFCREARLPFYERLGWRPIYGTVTADQPTGVVTVPLVTCWTPLVEGAELPDVDLHVVGLPF